MFVLRSTYDREIAAREAHLERVEGINAVQADRLVNARRALRDIATGVTAKAAPAARRMAQRAREGLDVSE